MTGLYACEHCGAEYPSQLAASECEETDRAEDLHNRQYFSRGRDQ
jgi:hypothetical protein